MARRIPPALSALLIVLLPIRPALPAEGRPADDLPNLVVFLVDDMGVMDTSVPFLTDPSGAPFRHPLNDRYRTPSMERLAQQGVRFSQFYAMSVCSPTRLSILTGQNAARHGTTNWIHPRQNNGGPQGPPNWNWSGLKKGETTLPGLLRERGYRTLHVGKGHFGPEGSEGADPTNLGFEVNVAGGSTGAPGSYRGAKNYRGGKDGKRNPVPGLEPYHGTDTFLTEALTLEAKRLVGESVKASQPFFLYLAHYAVHAPFESDPRFAAHYLDSGLPPSWQAFATLIEGMDKSLGDLLDELESLGVAANTLVLFLGDNGSDAPLGGAHEVACAAPLRGKKGSHYEGGMRVPFIAAWAKSDPDNPWQRKLPIAAGRIQSQVADVTGLFPTLLGLVDAMPDSGEYVVDGFPLGPWFDDKPDPPRPAKFLMHYPHAVHRSNYFTVWRDGDWKLIHHALPAVPAKDGAIQSGGKRYQLFDLKEDPYEGRDLSGSDPKRMGMMIEGMRSELARHGALPPRSADGEPILPPDP